METTGINAPILTTIAGQSLTSRNWSVKMHEPDVSYLRQDQDGSVRPYMCLPHIPDSEYKIEITLTFNGEDSKKLRDALQALVIDHNTNPRRSESGESNS